MIRVLLLIFDPISTWERIFRARRGLFFILVLYLIPLVALACAAEGYGLVRWGRWREFGAEPHRYTVGEAVLFEAIQFLLTLIVVFVGAKIIKSLAETFHGHQSYSQTFTLVAYGLGPLFLLRFLDASAEVPYWVSWPIGIILSIGVLYQGVPRIMEPDPPHAFGLFLMGSLLLALITGLARFFAAWYLLGKFEKLEALISRLAKQLPF